jgi:presenilin 1
MDTFYDEHSVLDDLGAEVTGIAFPVSICMALTIILVRLLHRDDDEGTRTVVIAEVVREEVLPPVRKRDEVPGAAEAYRKASPACRRMRGSLINAIVFVVIVTAMTFIIVLLFKYGVRCSSSGFQNCSSRAISGPSWGCTYTVLFCSVSSSYTATWGSLPL